MKYERLTERGDCYYGFAKCKTCDYGKDGCDKWCDQITGCFCRLQELEDKIEAGTLVEVPKGEVVLTPEERAEKMRLANAERKQVVREFAEKLRDKEFSVKIGAEWFAVVKSRDIVELVKEVCGE